MKESLLNTVRGYSLKAFKLANGEIFCRTSLLPLDLAAQVRAHNEGTRPRRSAVVVRDTPPAKSAGQIAREGLYQACFDRLREHGDRVTLATADRLSEQVGVAAATELIREFGAGASMSGLALRHWARAAK